MVYPFYTYVMKDSGIVQREFSAAWQAHAHAIEQSKIETVKLACVYMANARALAYEQQRQCVARYVAGECDLVKEG
jgi:hypothetical protein